MYSLRLLRYCGSRFDVEALPHFYKLRGIRLAQFSNQLRHDFEQIANDAVVSHGENRGFGIC